MRSLNPFLALLVFAAGCRAISPLEYRMPPVYRYSLRDAPTAYAYHGDGAPGDSIGVLPLRTGDSILAYGHALYYLMKDSLYAVMLGSDTVLCSYDNLVSEYDYQVSLQKLTFRLPSAEAQTAWARGIRWLVERSGMKIRVASEYAVETYGIRRSRFVGYTLSRVPLQGEEELTVTVFPQAQLSDTLDAKGCAFFMRTGREF